jgi:hypothetical protein
VIRTGVRRRSGRLLDEIDAKDLGASDGALTQARELDTRGIVQERRNGVLGWELQELDLVRLPLDGADVSQHLRSMSGEEAQDAVLVLDECLLLSRGGPQQGAQYDWHGGDVTARA